MVCVLVDVHVVDVVTGVAAKGALPGLAGVATEVGPGPRSWARQGVRGGVQRVRAAWQAGAGCSACPEEAGPVVGGSARALRSRCGGRGSRH